MCQCPPGVRIRYRSRLSGPLLDRVDLQVDVVAVRSAALFGTEPAESSATVAARVARARQAAAGRWAPHARSNGEVPAAVLRGRRFRLPRAVLQPLATAMDRGQLSARGLDRTTRVAWTVADLDGRDRPGVDDVNEALEMRSRRGR